MLRKFLKKIKKNIRLLINYLMPWLPRNGYPSLNLHTRKETGYLYRRMSNFDETIDKLRRSFWKFFAKKHEPFGCCYYRSFPLSKDPIYENLQINGFAKVENFLESDEIKFIQYSSRKISNKLKENNGAGPDYGMRKLCEEGSDIISRKLSNFSKAAFLEDLAPRSIVNFIKSENGINDNADTAIWHADRFIPCINGLFFPFGCDWLPFERLLKSPYLGKDKDIMRLQQKYENIYDYDRNSEIFQSFCKPNTLIIGFHHIMHRRSIIKNPGERLCIFIEWYNVFNRAKLIKSALFK